MDNVGISWILNFFEKYVESWFLNVVKGVENNGLLGIMVILLLWIKFVIGKIVVL